MYFLGRELFQDDQDFPIWKKFLSEYKIKTLLELGTGYGGMSLWLALQCRDFGIEFFTFDNVQGSDFMLPIEQELKLKDKFHYMNIFSDIGISRIKGIIDSNEHPIAIFCDDGEKPREWRTFGPMLSPGDFIAVHDWNAEFYEENVGDLPVERILTAECDARPEKTWRSMWYKRL